MKKFLCFFIMAILSVLLFSSCSLQKEKTVIEKIISAMEKVSSYESNGDLNIKIDYSDDGISIYGKTNQIVLNDKRNDLYFYTQNDVKVKYGKSITSTSVLQAYNDGTYFFSYSVGDSINKFCSDYTEKEFIDYYEKSSESGNILSGYNKYSLVVAAASINLS